MDEVSLCVITTLSIILIILLVFYSCHCYSQCNRLESDGIVKSNGLIGSESFSVEPKEILSKLSNIKFKLDNNDDEDYCDNIKSLITDTNEVVKNIIDSAEDKDEIALCKYDLSRNVIEQQMANSIHPDKDRQQHSYNTIVEWEGEEREIVGSKVGDKAMFKYLLNNVELLITLIRKDVCVVNRLDLNKLSDKLNKWNDHVCGRVTNYDKSAQLFDYDTEGDLITRGSTKRFIEPMNNVSGEYLSSANTDSMVSKPSIEGAVNTLNEKSWEHISDEDIINNRPIGHTIGTTNAEDYYTTLVSACNGKIIPASRITEECVVYYDKMKSALDGDPSKMISNLSNSFHD